MDVIVLQGKFGDAARLYKKYGQERKALNMYTDLRMFDHAKEFLGAADSADGRALIKMKAEWAEKSNEPRAAAEMYLSAGGFVSLCICTTLLWCRNTSATVDSARMSEVAGFFAGESLKAIEIIGEHGWIDMLNDVGRKLDKADTEPIRQVSHCAE